MNLLEQLRARALCSSGVSAEALPSPLLRTHRSMSPVAARDDSAVAARDGSEGAAKSDDVLRAGDADGSVNTAQSVSTVREAVSIVRSPEERGTAFSSLVPHSGSSKAPTIAGVIAWKLFGQYLSDGQLPPFSSGDSTRAKSSISLFRAMATVSGPG